MTETFLSLAATYGLYAAAISAFLSCLLVPIPTALVMLAGGAFAASGDLVLGQVLGAAWLGAILGDHAGFQIGRLFGPALERRLKTRRKAEAGFARARDMVAKRGGTAVFFSTWALAPLGPYVNLAAGAGGLGRIRFTLCDAAGEAIWVGFYVLMGYSFATEITQLSSMLSNAAGFVTAIALAGGLGWIMLRRIRQAEETGSMP